MDEVFCNKWALFTLYLMKVLSDSHMLDQLKRGDQEAYTDLYNEHAQSIYRFVYFRVGSQEVAEDIMQETFLKFIDVIDTAHVTNVRAYLYRIARNLVTDLYRKKSQQEVVDIDAAYDLESMQGHLQMEAGIDLQMMARAIEHLKPLWREIITLRHIESLSYKEIASVIGHSSAYVRVNLHRATKALNEYFTTHQNNETR